MSFLPPILQGEDAALPIALCLEKRSLLGVLTWKRSRLDVVASVISPEERPRARAEGVGVEGSAKDEGLGGEAGASCGAGGGEERGCGFGAAEEDFAEIVKEEAAGREPVGARRVTELRLRPEPMKFAVAYVFAAKEPSPKVRIRACAAENISRFARRDDDDDDDERGEGLEWPWMALGRYKAPVLAATGDEVMEGRATGLSFLVFVGVALCKDDGRVDDGVVRERGVPTRCVLAEVGRGEGVGIGESAFVGVPDSVYFRLRGIDLPLLT